jgi:hypothetical protein
MKSGKLLEMEHVEAKLASLSQLLAVGLQNSTFFNLSCAAADGAHTELH